MSEIHLSDLSKIYKEQIVEKKDDSYLEPDMKKRQKNNEKARKELAKGPQMKNPHFEEKQKESDIAKSLADAYKAVHEEGYGAPGHNPGSGEKSVARAKALMDKKGQKGAPGLDAMRDANKEHEARRGVKKEALDPVGQEDGDIDNDGDKDKSDKYLAKRRKAIGKAIKGKMKKEDFIPEVMSDMSDSMDDKPIKEKKVKNVIKVNPKLGESVEEIGGELIEAIEIVDILEEITDQELRFVSDRMIDEVVEEFFLEAAEQDEDLEVLQQNLCESIDLSISLLLEQDAGAEARNRLGNGPSRASVMDRVKSAVKKGAKVARKAVVKGSEVAGKAVGHAKNLAKDMGSAAKKGYQSTQSGSSDSSSSSDSGSSSSSASKKPGLLSRIGAKLKRGIGKAARAVSRGSRNLARKMDEENLNERGDFWNPDPDKDKKLGGPGANQRAREDGASASKPKSDPKKLRPGESYLEWGKRQKANKMKEEVEVDEAMSSYDKNRKRAAQRAADRNAARAAGKTGVVPGVGYVTPRREKETYTDEKGTVRHKSGAKNEEVEVEEGMKPLPKNKMFRKAGNLGRDGSPEAMERSKKITKTLNKANEEVENVEEIYKGKHGQTEKQYQDSRSNAGKMVSGDSKGSGANYSYRAKNTGSNPAGGSEKPQGQARMGSKDRAYLKMQKANLRKEDAAMSPQEIQLQKKKAMLDRMIAQRRQQGLTKKKATESPAKAMGEETEDSLKDRRMERGGVDGNNRYKSAPKNVAMGGGKKKPYDGMSALEKVKASIRAKHGQGAIMDTKKK